MKWTDVGRPDLNSYYEHISELILKFDPAPVNVLDLVGRYDTTETRFNAMSALMDMASTGTIQINTIRENDGQDNIRSFQITL